MPPHRLRDSPALRISRTEYLSAGTNLATSRSPKKRGSWLSIDRRKALHEQFHFLLAALLEELDASPATRWRRERIMPRGFCEPARGRGEDAVLDKPPASHCARAACALFTLGQNFARESDGSAEQISLDNGR